MTETVDPAAIVVTIVVVLGVAFALTWAILRAAKYPAPTLMVTTLAILTMLCIIGLGTAGEATEQIFGTLAATGMGALAGAVTSQFTSDNDQKSSTKEESDDSSSGQ